MIASHRALVVVGVIFIACVAEGLRQLAPGIAPFWLYGWLLALGILLARVPDAPAARTAPAADVPPREDELKSSLPEAPVSAEDRTDKQKHAFISQISHEVRTPLHAILGLLELLENNIDERNRSLIHKIRNAAHALMNVLNNTIEAARSDNNALRINRSESNLYQLIAEIADIFSTSAELKNLQFCVHFDPQLYGINVNLDRMHLMQVLNNLMGNAIKFTDSGEITLWVIAQSRSDQMVRIYFGVQDTGAGIDKADQDIIFEPFGQVDSMQSGRQPGSGLGLKISRDIIRMMDSELNLSSVRGAGSTFWFVLDGQYKPTSVQPPTALSRSAIALVGDAGRQREILTTYIESIGAQVLHFDRVDDIRSLTGCGMILIGNDQHETNEAALTRLLVSHQGLYVVVAKSNTVDWRAPAGVVEWFSPLLLHELYQHCERAGICERPLDIAAASAAPKGLDDLTEEATIDILPESIRNATFLIVDDSPVNLVVLQGQLDKLGISELLVATDGSKALRVLEGDTRVDIIITDFNMPHMNGPELAKHVRALYPGIVVVGLTALQESDAYTSSSLERFDDIILKPCGLSALGQRLAILPLNNEAPQNG